MLFSRVGSRLPFPQTRNHATSCNRKTRRTSTRASTLSAAYPFFLNPLFDCISACLSNCATPICIVSTNAVAMTPPFSSSPFLVGASLCHLTHLAAASRHTPIMLSNYIIQLHADTCSCIPIADRGGASGARRKSPEGDCGAIQRLWRSS